MADTVHAEAVNSAKLYDQSKLKHVETKEKNPLPSKQALEKEKRHQNFVNSLNKDNTHNLRPMMTKEKIENLASDEKRKSLAQEIAQAPEAKEKLRPVMTEEKVESLKSDEKHGNLVKGIEGFKKDEMKHIEPQEKVALPDAETVKEVKKHETLMSSIQKPDVDLNPVMTREKADSMSKDTSHQALAEQIKQAQEAKDQMRHIVTSDEAKNLAQGDCHKDLVNAIHQVDQVSLRPTMTKEKVDAMKDDKTHKGLVDGIGKAKRESLKHIEPQEKVVLPDAQTVEEVKKQENFLRSLEDEQNKDKLRPTMTRDRAESLSKEKGHQDLVKELQSAAHNKEDMRHVMTKEKVEDMKKDVYHKSIVKGIEGFEKEGLKPAETEEKTALPDKDAIDAEKQHQKRLSDIEGFNKSQLGHAETKEKSCLPTSKDIIAEKTVAET